MKGIVRWAGVGLVVMWLAVPGAALAVDVDAWVKGLAGFGPAINAGKIDALVSGWTEDSVRIHPALGEVKGQEGQRGFFKYLYDNFRDQAIVVHRYAGKDDLIYVEWTWSAVHKESGKRVMLDELVWIQVAGDGRIKKLRQYFDTAAFGKQLE